MSLQRRIAARPRRVFELLTHHEAMPEWFPAHEVVRRRPGDQDPNGLGAIRVVDSKLRARAVGIFTQEDVDSWKALEDAALWGDDALREDAVTFQKTLRQNPNGPA